jgi:hypothetical protein
MTARPTSAAVRAAAALLGLLAGLALAGAIAAPATAAPTTLETAEGAQRPQPFQGWIEGAQVPTPSGLVTLVLEACPVNASAAGCAFAQARRVHLAPLNRDRRTFFHELGHVFDVHVLTTRDRERFRALAGVRGPWFGPVGADSPGEQFAEAYSLCARFRTIGRTQFGMYDYVATPARHATVCGLIRRAAA